MTKKDKIQHLLITTLMEQGTVSLSLPSGITLEVGVTKETKHGIEKCNDYCWVSTTKDQRAMFMDQYNLQVKYPNEKIILEGDTEEEVGTITII